MTGRQGKGLDNESPSQSGEQAVGELDEDSLAELPSLKGTSSGVRSFSTPAARVLSKVMGARRKSCSSHRVELPT